MKGFLLDRVLVDRCGLEDRLVFGLVFGGSFLFLAILGCLGSFLFRLTLRLDERDGLQRAIFCVVQTDAEGLRIVLLFKGIACGVSLLIAGFVSIQLLLACLLAGRDLIVRNILANPIQILANEAEFRIFCDTRG